MKKVQRKMIPRGEYPIDSIFYDSGKKCLKDFEACPIIKNLTSETSNQPYYDGTPDFLHINCKSSEWVFVKGIGNLPFCKFSMKKCPINTIESELYLNVEDVGNLAILLSVHPD